jgi:beta-glucosidase
VKAPIRTLKGFQRVSLKKGESKLISFTLPPEALSALNTEHERVLLPGSVEISVGGAQPGTKAPMSSNLVQSIVKIQ